MTLEDFKICNSIFKRKKQKQNGSNILIFIIETLYHSEARLNV